MISINFEKYKAEGLVCLTSTQPVTKEMLIHEHFKFLKEQYDNEVIKGDPVLRACVSVLNSILHQRRGIFVLTRDIVKDLASQDGNWRIRKTFRNDKYAQILKICMDRTKMFEVRTEGDGRRPASYRVVDKGILKALGGVDWEAQAIETDDFISGTATGTTMGTATGTKPYSHGDMKPLRHKDIETSGHVAVKTLSHSDSETVRNNNTVTDDGSRDILWDGNRCFVKKNMEDALVEEEMKIELKRVYEENKPR